MWNDRRVIENLFTPSTDLRPGICGGTLIELGAKIIDDAHSAFPEFLEDFVM